MKNIYLVVAPSGAGKTLITETLEHDYGYKSIQSYTTRPKRSPDETGHTFVTDAEFDKLTDMVAYTEFCGNRYCATKEQVEANDLYVIDPKGVEYFKEKYNGNKGIKIIFIRSDLSARYERMCGRYTNNGDDRMSAADKALTRVANDAKEFYSYEHGEAHIDFEVENGLHSDITDVVTKIADYIKEAEVV